MLNRILPLTAILLLPAAARLLAEPAVDPIQTDRRIATLLPERSLLVLEAPGLAPLLERGLEDPLLRTVLDGGVDDLLKTGAGMNAQELLNKADEFLGKPLLPTLSSLSRHGVGLGVGVAPGGAAWALVMHGDDPELLRATLDDAFDRLEEEYGVAGAFDKPHDRWSGADVWNLDELKLATRDGLFAASNSEAWLRDVLELAADPEALGATGNASFIEAFPAEDGSLFRAFVDLERAETLARLAGTENKVTELRKLPSLPQVQLLLGPGVASFGSARALAASVELRGTQLSMSVIGIGAQRVEPLEADASRPLPPGIAPHAEDSVRMLAYRDFRAAFADRVDLFPPEMIPKFSKAESDLALFFGGEDLVEDVLPGVSPWIRVVARTPTFESGAIPENPLPAAAVLFALEDAENLGPKLSASFQTLIGGINLGRAQEGQSAFLLGLELVGDVQITSAALPRPGPEDGVDIQYNLTPACAWVGDAFIMSTHVSLARDLVRELTSGDLHPRGLPVESIALDGIALARVIDDNRETLVMQNALEEGHGMDAARGEIAALRTLVAAFAKVEASIRRPAEDRVELTLLVDVAGGGSR